MISFTHPNREAAYRMVTSEPHYQTGQRKCKVCGKYKGTGGGSTKNGFTCKECKERAN